MLRLETGPALSLQWDAQDSNFWMLRLEFPLSRREAIETASRTRFGKGAHIRGIQPGLLGRVNPPAFPSSCNSQIFKERPAFFEKAALCLPANTFAD
jgi:hypothetical protein